MEVQLLPCHFSTDQQTDVHEGSWEIMLPRIEIKHDFYEEMGKRNFLKSRLKETSAPRLFRKS